MRDISDAQAFSYDPAALGRLLTRYGAREAAIALAQADASFAAAASDASPVSGTLEILLYRTDRPGAPVLAARLSVTSMQGETRGRALDRAVALVQRTLASDWKNGTPQQMAATPAPAPAYAASPSSAAPYPAAPPAAAATNAIDIRVRYANLPQWANARRALSRIPGVSNVVLRSIAPREARVSAYYNGGADALRIALLQSGMYLSQDAPSGAYTLSLDAPQPSYAPAYNPAPRAAPAYNGVAPYVNTF
jgi:hypothetical protein